MRKYILLFYILCGLCFIMRSQNKALLYDFNEIPQSLMVNPGVQSDFKWYAGVPLLSQFSFQAGSSGISVADLFADDGLDFNTKFRNRAIFGMTPEDELSGNFQLELLNIGFRGKNSDAFYSFGIYTEGDAIGYWFRDYAILGFEGNANRLNQKFDLGDLKTRGELLNVFHFGVNKKINQNLTLGFRGKIYSSIFDFNSANNKGFFVTEAGDNNLLASTIEADLELRSSGIRAIRDARNDDNIASTVLKRGFFGGNLGVGIDLGFTYNLDEKTVMTGSLLDLGFIYHTNDVKNYILKGSTSVEGIEIILPDALADPDRDFYQDLIDDVDALVPFEENSDSYISFRPTKLYFSIRHDFGEQITSRANCECGPYVTRSSARAQYANSYGGQVYMIMRPRGPQAALTAFYMRRFGNLLAAKATYTIDKFSVTNIGLGLNLQAGPVNFFVLADNILGYRDVTDSHYASFQLGLNIISWGKN